MEQQCIQHLFLQMQTRELITIKQYLLKIWMENYIWSGIYSVKRNILPLYIDRDFFFSLVARRIKKNEIIFFLKNRAATPQSLLLCLVLTIKSV